MHGAFQATAWKYPCNRILLVSGMEVSMHGILQGSGMEVSMREILFVSGVKGFTQGESQPWTTAFRTRAEGDKGGTIISKCRLTKALPEKIGLYNKAPPPPLVPRGGGWGRKRWVEGRPI